MSRRIVSTVFVGAVFVIAGCAEPGPVSPERVDASLPSFGHVAGEVTAHANLHRMNQSGVRGRIDFTDNGGETHEGVAWGLDGGVDDGTYISLTYDNVTSGGPSAGPNKVDACEPVIPFDGMFLGIWIVDADGHGILLQLGPRAPISEFRTVSIRDTRINDGFGTDAIVACGEVATHGGN